MSDVSLSQVKVLSDSWVSSILSSSAHLIAVASWPLFSIASFSLRCSDCKLILLKQSSRLRRQDPRCYKRSRSRPCQCPAWLVAVVGPVTLHLPSKRIKCISFCESSHLGAVLSWRCQIQEFIYRPAKALGSWRAPSKGEANEKKPPWRLSRNAWAVCLPWWQMTWLHHSCLQSALLQAFHIFLRIARSQKSVHMAG